MRGPSTHDFAVSSPLVKRVHPPLRRRNPFGPPGLALLLAAAAGLLAGCVSFTPYATVRETVPAESLLRIDDHLVHVIDRGPRGAAETVVFVHGFGASSYSWRRITPELPEYRTIALDLNGFGYTERPHGLEPYTRSGQVELIRGVLDRLGLERVDLVGHSYGGAIVLTFADRYPDRLRSLTIVDSARPDYPETRRRSIARWRPALDLYLKLWALHYRSVRKALLHSVWDDALITPDLVEAYLERLRIEGAVRAYYGVTAPAPEPREVVRLDRLEMPLLVVWGVEDPLIPIEKGRHATAQVPCHRFVAIPDSGHLPMEEQPEAVVAALRSFLADPQAVCNEHTAAPK